METVLGIIGGSGLYELPGLKNIQRLRVDTPFGAPSDLLVTGELFEKKVVFLPRHGIGHRHTPTEVNYRANIYALKKMGVTHILSVSAVGSLQEEFSPGMFVVPHQIIDKTASVRHKTFFGRGVVGHVGFALPYCPEFQAQVIKAAQLEKVTCELGGTYVCVEGPRFSSKAESLSFKKEGASIIGMTAMPEACLAREAEIAYCTLALVTDYDCWKEHSAAVSVEAVMEVMKKNVENSKKVVLKLIENFPKNSDNPVFSAARHSIMTQKELIPLETRKALELFYGKYWN
jgi:5'-methylthioadenosine phosphorylase